MLFVAGPHAAGKTFFAKYLESYGFEYVDLGPTLREIWKNAGTDLTFQEFVAQGEIKCGPNFTDNLLAEAISQKLYCMQEEGITRDLLIIGNRSAQGIEYLKHNVNDPNVRGSQVIYIDAETSLRHKRYCEREGKQVSLKEFEEILEKDRKLGLEGIKKITDHFILNEGQPEMFVLSIENLIFSQIGYERKNGRKE